MLESETFTLNIAPEVLGGCFGNDDGHPSMCWLTWSVMLVVAPAIHVLAHMLEVSQFFSWPSKPLFAIPLFLELDLFRNGEVSLRELSQDLIEGVALI